MIPSTTSLPAGWAEATVGDLGEFINGLAFKPADWGTAGRPIIRIQNLTNKEAPFNFTRTDFDPRFVVKHGDILVSWSATLDAFTWRGPEAILNQHIFKVVPTNQIPEHRFVFWALKNAIAEMWESPHTHGTTMRHINRKPFMAHCFALPPLREQVRLADALDSYFTRLEAAEATLERVKRNLERYRASVLQAALEGRLVQTEAAVARRERRSFETGSALVRRLSPSAVEVTPEAGGLPEGWTTVRLGSIAEVRLGRQRSPSRAFGRNMRPYIRAANVTWVGVSTEDVKEMDFTPDEFQTFALRRGDILLSEASGSPTEVGKPAIWDEQVPNCCFQNTLIRVRADKCLVPFLYLHFLSDAVGGSFSRASKGVGIHHLSAGTLEAWPTKIPPLAEQARIVAETEQALSVVRAVQKAIAVDELRCARLKQSVLAVAFEGRLVDQDPTDEPASVLLDRIRTERAKAAASPETPRRRGRPRKAVKK